MICFGNIPIDRNNLENYNNAVLDPRNPWDPVSAFAPAIRAAKSRGAICLPQLQFPGRQVPEFLNKDPKSASDVQLGPCLNKSYGKPTALTRAEITELVARYVWAADVLARAGADGIIVSLFLTSETSPRVLLWARRRAMDRLLMMNSSQQLHGAHGYILNQFLSPLTNRRTDEVSYLFSPRLYLILNLPKRL